MQVLCIKQGLWENEDYGKHNWGPKYGEECAVIAIDEAGYYKLAEYQVNPINNKPSVFRPDRFIPLSSIDETEMERNYNTQTA